MLEISKKNEILAVQNGYMTFRPIHFQPMHFQPLPFQPLPISTYCIFNCPQFRPINFGYLVFIRLSFSVQ